MLTLIRLCPILTLLSTGLLLLDKVSAHGNMNLQLLQYTSDGLTILGTSCDGPSDPCDPQFRITADKSEHGGQGLFVFQQTSHYSNQNVVRFSSIIGEASNPLIIPMNYNDNLGSLRLTVYVNDYDVGNTAELMSKFTAELTASGTETRVLELSSGAHRLTLNYWYTCTETYYGSLCNHICKPSDDSVNGHFWCTTGGVKVCRYGWVDSNTNCINPHPCRTCICQNGGTCAPEGDSYTCMCPAWYTGSNCQTCTATAAGGCSGSAATTSCQVPDYSVTTATSQTADGGVCFGLSAFIPVAAVACLGTALAAIFAVVWHLERSRAD